MKKTKIIKVTQKDINNAPRSSEYPVAQSCPVALAVNRAFKQKFGFAEVLTESINIGGTWVPITKKTERFIIDYDCGKSVKPFSFTLRY
jgi:hypothetical protein